MPTSATNIERSERLVESLRAQTKELGCQVISVPRTLFGHFIDAHGRMIPRSERSNEEIMRYAAERAQAQEGRLRAQAGQRSRHAVSAPPVPAHDEMHDVRATLQARGYSAEEIDAAERLGHSGVKPRATRPTSVSSRVDPEVRVRLLAKGYTEEEIAEASALPTNYSFGED